MKIGVLLVCCGLLVAAVLNIGSWLLAECFWQYAVAGATTLTLLMASIFLYKERDKDEDKTD